MPTENEQRLEEAIHRKGKTKWPTNMKSHSTSLVTMEIQTWKHCTCSVAEWTD